MLCAASIEHRNRADMLGKPAVRLTMHDLRQLTACGRLNEGHVPSVACVKISVVRRCLDTTGVAMLSVRVSTTASLPSHYELISIPQRGCAVVSSRATQPIL